MTDTYEPTPEEQHAYDMASRGYVGYDKPKIAHIKEKSNLLSPVEAEIELGDHLRIDEQGYE